MPQVIDVYFLPNDFSISTLHIGSVSLRFRLGMWATSTSKHICWTAEPSASCTEEEETQKNRATSTPNNIHIIALQMCNGRWLQSSQLKRLFLRLIFRVFLVYFLNFLLLQCCCGCSCCCCCGPITHIERCFSHNPPSYSVRTRTPHSTFYVQFYDSCENCVYASRVARRRRWTATAKCILGAFDMTFIHDFVRVSAARTQSVVVGRLSHI